MLLTIGNKTIDDKQATPEYANWAMEIIHFDVWTNYRRLIMRGSSIDLLAIEQWAKLTLINNDDTDWLAGREQTAVLRISISI